MRKPKKELTCFLLDEMVHMESEVLKKWWDQLEATCFVVST